MPAFGTRRLSDSDLDDLLALSADAARLRSRRPSIGDSHARHELSCRATVLSGLVAFATTRADRPAGAAAAGVVAGDPRGPAGRRLALADLRRQLRQPPPQPADADHAGQRRQAGAAVDVPDRRHSATSRPRRSCATTCCTSPVRRTSPGRSTRAPAARSGAIAASCRESLTACCGLVNRGFAMLGDKLFMTTLDAHLLALDMRTGAMVWDADAGGVQRTATPPRSRRSSSRTR